MSGTQRMLAQELAALGLDLESTLNEEPRFLLDARFLGALHSELADQLGEEDARAALLQMGFLHGLRDAALLLASGFGHSLETTPSAPTASRLAMRMEPSRGQGFAFAGSWPERHEAEAVLESLGRSTEPVCHVSSGYTSGWLSGILDADMLALEERCGARGDSACRFRAQEASSWIAQGEGAALRQLEGLPFGPLRDTVARHLMARPAPEPERNESFEAGAPVVHVWGPVMVLPFSGPDESLRALDLIGRDPGARDVRVVVVDLHGTLIDEGFGASALEQVLDAIEGWGAEPLLSGVSPLSERVVAGLEHNHLVVHKDLPEAIAAAFQIAEAQRVAS